MPGPSTRVDDAGRVALVTGGGRGLGAASAYELAKSGLSVMVNYHANAEAAATTVERIRELGARASALQADVRQAADCAALVAGTLGEFGRLDVLVVNASIRFRTAPITDLTWADVESKLTGEISAAFHSVQAAFPALAERGGRIVLVSSLMATTPTPGFAAHGTAKGALSSFGRYLAAEWGPQGISTAVVAPGTAETDATSNLPREVLERIRAATPTGILTQPEDVGSVVAAVATADTLQLNGALVPVNGGLVTS